jgi:membrane-bound lytic murein transglycosylase C
MLKNILIILLISSFVFAQTLAEFKAEQKQKFKIYKKHQEDGFRKYRQEQLKAFSEYKKDIAKVWEKPKMSTKKSWVSYTKDKKTRSIVNFDKESIKIQTVAPSQKEAIKKLQVALAKVVTIDTKTVQETDPLEQKIAKIKKPANAVDDKVKPEPILATVIFKKPPTKKSVKLYVKKHIMPKKIKVKKSKKVENQKVYTVFIKMPKDAMIRRSRLYYDEVKKQSKTHKIPVSLVFAIMHSESSFNPRARSYVPAYGLMQIVPRTAGIDAYNYLYHKKKLVTGSYLYNSRNNIIMGSAYLHILYYRYLRKIKNPQSRLYCTIAAYNTGTGNIAYAFTKSYNMNRAAPIINSMTPDEVYAKLMKDLRWDEPKKYLKKVSQRMVAYKKVYGS